MTERGGRKEKKEGGEKKEEWSGRRKGDEVEGIMEQCRGRREERVRRGEELSGMRVGGGGRRGTREEG